MIIVGPLEILCILVAQSILAWIVFWWMSVKYSGDGFKEGRIRQWHDKDVNPYDLYDMEEPK